MRDQLTLLAQAAHRIAGDTHHLQLIAGRLQLGCGNGQFRLATLQLRRPDHIGTQQLLCPVFSPLCQLAVGMRTQVGQLSLGQLRTGDVCHGLTARDTVTHVHQDLRDPASNGSPDAGDLLFIGLNTAGNLLNRGQLVLTDGHRLEALEHLRPDADTQGVICVAARASLRGSSRRIRRAGCRLLGVAAGGQHHHTSSGHKRRLEQFRRQVHVNQRGEGVKGLGGDQGDRAPTAVRVVSWHGAPPTAQVRSGQPGLRTAPG